MEDKQRFTIMLIALISGIVLVRKSLSFTLNLSGYEHCWVHIIDLDLGENQATTDLIENLIISNPTVIQWTATYRLSLDQDKYYYREVCSVNILAVANTCERYNNWLLSFGIRFTNVANSYIVIHGSGIECLNRINLIDSKMRFIVNDILLFYLSAEYTKLELVI